MNSKQNSQKDINEYKIVVPMSNETANKIKSNITKSILGVSIAGVMITGAATQAKAEAIENPTAIVQEVKEEERARYKEELAAIVEGLLSKGNEATTLANRDKTSLSTGEEDVLDNQIQSLSVNREEASGDQELSAQSLEDSVEISSVENPASIFAANRPSASEESDAEIETSSAKAEEEALTETLSAGQGQEADLASAKTDDEAQSNKAKTEDATEESLSEDQVQKDQVEKEANAEEAKAEVEETPAAKAEEKAEENSDVETGNSEAEVPDQEEPKNEETIEENNSTSLDALKNTEALGNLFDAEKIKTDAVKNLGAEDKIEVGEEKTPEAQKAPGEENEPNYAEDEAKIKDFNESERYRSTQMEQGNGTAADFTPPDEMDKFIDGYRYHSSEPSATSEDKTKWGVEIEIDKEKGQRTYTDFYFTNGANLGDVLETGNVSANEAGDTITGGNKNPNYKATSEIEITGSRAQRNLNLYASEEDLKHINNQDNTNTTMAWQGKYLKDHPNGLKATEGTSAAFGFTVNPWPNENDKLDLIKLNGSHNQKEFVQGQTITTNVQVENLDDSARERLVGQVYHPITGEVVPGAKAYINDEGKVVVEMPKGTINEDGSINEDSIFYKDTKYKGIQNLEVKFFARPRTADEFKAIVEGNQAGFYTGTGAGTATINHNGKDVVIDKQGIDRYDHYNLIGGFKLNLDDTRYYDQGFIDENNEDTSKHTSSKVKPGEELDVNLYVPEDKKDKDVFPNQKTPEDMEAAKDANQAVGTIDWQFINKINEGKKPEDQWKLDYDESTLPTKFKITPPESAKAGDFVAVPLTYTYTNGSTDVHWFHFVVQESDYIKPDYETQVNFPVKEQTSPAIVKDDGKRITPDHYTLPDTLETDEAGNKLVTDDSGNKWTVTLDEETGKVSAKPVDPTAFDGGEKLTVPVIAHYKDEQKPGEDITEDANAYFVIEEKANMTPRYNAKAGKAGDALSSGVILNEEDRYNRRPGKYTLDSPTYTDDKGNTWNVSIDEETGVVTATVPNAEEGKSIDGALLNVPVTAHYYEEDAEGNKVESGTKTTEVQFVAYGTNGKVEKTEEIPFETKVEKDPNLKKGEIKVITEGKKGSKKVTYTIKDSKVDEEKITEEVIEEAVDRVIHVGEGVLDGSHKIEEKAEVPFEVEIEFDDSLAPGEQKVTQEGVPGEKTRTTTLTIENSEVTKTEAGDFEVTKQPVKKIIKVGRNTEGEVVHKEEIPFKYTVEYDPSLKAGEYKVETPGRNGERITTWTIKNSKADGDPKVVETQPIDAVIKVGNKDFTGEFKTTKKEAVEFETEYIVDNSIEPGKAVVEQEGELGEKETPVTHTITNGQVTKSEEGETKQTKAPVKRIVKVGPAKTDGSHTYTNKKPFEVEVRVNPELKKGEHKVVQKGVEGEEEYTITIENSKVTNTSEPKETKAPVNEIIEVGSEDFTGTLETKKTKAVEFETEYVVDNSMEPGTTKVEQEGELGEEETTVTHTIVNGEVTKSEEGETKQTKAPVKRIVKVGPAKTDGTHTYTNKKPFEVEVRVNPELKKGEHKVVQKGVEGEEEYTITIENSKVTNTSEPKETKAPVKEIIEVGSEDYTGTVEYVDKDPVPYETEVTVDPSLKPGEIVEDQKGELGEQETKITRTITNGEAGEENRGETTRTKEPVNRKIRVGSQTDGQYKETETIPFEVEVRKDPSLKKGEWKYAEVDGVQQTGESGLKERTLTIVNSKVTEESEFKTTREPKKAIILVGEESNEGEVTHTEEIPFGYKVEEVDTLKKGEYKIVKPGKVGSKTTTWKIKDSQIDGEPKEEIQAAEDALIQVGKGTNDGTHDFTEKKELPFETRYEYDDSLEPGEEKVVQEGKPGLQERTNTIVIQDGKVTEVKEGEFKTVTEPEERIVKIGRKPTEGETTKTIEREIPYETKIIYDENLEAGFQEIENAGKPGKEEVTITQKVKDSKPVGDPTETTKTITEKEDRVVRIGVKPVVKETELGNNTEYRHNPELEAGEEKVIEEGSKGSVKYTTTFNKETGKLEVKEERVEPKNKVVEYGSKTDGEFTYESEEAYDIIIRENPDLPAGTVNEIQEGIKGKTKTTVKIENSKEVYRDTETLVEKQDRIIEIGTKNICPIPEEPGEDPKDPETPGGEDQKDPETPGEEDPEKPGKEDPKNPETPGEDKPNEPGTPGETPEEPGKPAEDKPNEPGTPGEENPSEPGGETPDQPGTPGEENPSEPGTEEPGETVENPEEKSEFGDEDSTGKNTNPNEINENISSGAKRLPKTGDGINVSLYGYLAGVLGSGFLGLGALKKKKEDEEEEN